MSDNREAFEKWYAQKYLGVNVGDAFEYLPSHGYKRLDVYFPWLGYQAATAAADAKYLPVIEKLVEAGGKVIKRSSDATDANYNQPMMLVYEQDLDALMAAHDKFTEAK